MHSDRGRLMFATVASDNDYGDDYGGAEKPHIREEPVKAG